MKFNIVILIALMLTLSSCDSSNLEDNDYEIGLLQRKLLEKELNGCNCECHSELNHSDCLIKDKTKNMLSNIKQKRIEKKLEHQVANANMRASCALINSSINRNIVYGNR